MSKCHTPLVNCITQREIRKNREKDVVSTLHFSPRLRYLLDSPFFKTVLQIPRSPHCDLEMVFLMTTLTPRKTSKMQPFWSSLLFWSSRLQTSLRTTSKLLDKSTYPPLLILIDLMNGNCNCGNIKNWDGT